LARITAMLIRTMAMVLAAFTATPPLGRGRHRPVPEVFGEIGEVIDNQARAIKGHADANRGITCMRAVRRWQ